MAASSLSSSVPGLILLLILPLALSSCIERRTTGLEDLPKLPPGAGQVTIDMTGTWEIQEALPVSQTTQAQLTRAARGESSGAEEQSSPPVLASNTGTETLARFLAVLRIGAKLEIRRARFDRAAGLPLEESELSTPGLVNRRYVNQATGRFAVFHLLQETEPDAEEVGSLTLWLLTGATTENTMLGRVTLLIEEQPSGVELDWWIRLSRVGG